MIQRQAPEMISLRYIFAACLIFVYASALAQTPAPSTHSPTAGADETSSPTGTPKEETVFYIRSSGLIADTTFIAASLNEGGSAMSARLAFLILQARDQTTQITVAGGNETKTLRVIKDAFQSAGSVDLTLLDFIFIGSPKAASNVEKLVKAVHGTFHTRLKLDP
jgi:hypothetical protein